MDTIDMELSLLPGTASVPRGPWIDPDLVPPPPSIPRWVPHLLSAEICWLGWYPAA